MALPGETGSKQSGGTDALGNYNQNVTNTSLDNPNASIMTTTESTTITSTTTTDSGTTTNPSETKQPTLDQDDGDFDPTAEALIDDIDDERTLEEEEALDGNNANAVQNELDDLKKESEMPIEELLAYYERMRNEAGGQDEEEEEEDESEEGENDDITDKVDLIDDIEKRPKTKANENASITDFSECTSRSNSSANQNHQQQHHEQKPQTNPPIQSNSTGGGSHKPNHSTNINSNSYYQQQDHQQPDNISEDPARVQDVISNCQVNTSQEDNQLTSSDTIGSDGRHKHSMTEFMIDPDSHASGMFKTLLDYDLDDSDDMDEDYSYTDDENGDDERDWRRSIQIGSEHQAEVPEGLSKYEGDLLPYEPEDKLVWKCNSDLTQEQITEYLKLASSLSKRNDYSISPASVPKISDDTLRLYRERFLDMAVIPTTIGLHSIEHNHENVITELPPENLRDVYMSQSRKRSRIEYELEQENAMDGINQLTGDIQSNYLSNPVREENSNSTSQDARPDLPTQDYFHDEEQLLYLLLQCNFNLEEAVRRRRLDPSKYYFYEPMSLWSQEECLGFEQGLRTYGKNFHSIREHKVPTRTCSEVVAFYYLWKKSERHDVYTNQYKLDRKRCLSHPGTTDYMDRFIEDNESMLNASSSTPTPTPTPTDTTTNESNHLADMSNGNSSQLLSVCMPAFQSAPIPCINQLEGTLVMPSGNHVDVNSIIRNDEVVQADTIHLDNNNPNVYEH